MRAFCLTVARNVALDWLRRQQVVPLELVSDMESLDVLAALSHHANFSVGCYCEDERRCHRSLLRELLVARGAKLE